MDRKNLVKKVFDRSNELQIGVSRYERYLVKLFDFLLEHDKYQSDSSIFPSNIYNRKVEASIIAKSDGVVSCTEEVKFLLNTKSIDVKLMKKDGEKIGRGNLVFEISGKAKDILGVERTILNIFQRVCGISTDTHLLVEKIKKFDTMIAATRKTLLGNIEKKAVSVAGGLTHRLNLYDSAMLKDNHLKILSISEDEKNLELAIKEILVKNDELGFVEVEVKTPVEFNKVMKIATVISQRIPFAIMFDHFKPDLIFNILEDVKKSPDVYSKIFFEASGNINENNIAEYAESGVDVVSTGYITHSAKSLDFTLLIN